MIVRVLTMMYEDAPRLEIVPESKGESDFLKFFTKKNLKVEGSQCRGDYNDGGVDGVSLEISLDSAEESSENDDKNQRSAS